jgi:hypothetical protein
VGTVAAAAGYGGSVDSNRPKQPWSLKWGVGLLVSVVVLLIAVYLYDVTHLR